MKRKTMGWIIVFLLFIVYMLNYMDRSALSITAPLIEKELGFNAAEMGMIFSAFSLVMLYLTSLAVGPVTKLDPKQYFWLLHCCGLFLWYDRSGHRIMDNACRTCFIWYGRGPG